MSGRTRTLHIQQGAPYVHVLTVLQNDVPVPLSQGEWLAQIRVVPGGRIVATFTVDASQADQGIIVLSLTEEETAAMSQGGWWDLKDLTTGFVWVPLSQVILTRSVSVP